MPITLDCVFRRINATPRIDALKCGDKTLLVWWYCGILKNKNDQHQPLAKIAVRAQVSDNEFSDTVEYRDVAVEHLGQLRIGSVCKNNRVISRAEFKEQEFNVLHERGAFWFTSFHSAAHKRFSPPYPQSIHPLQFNRDKNWMIGFKLSAGGVLLIPTLEYFTRNYGRSGKLRRYLTTHQWGVPDGIPSAFFDPVDQPEEPGKWKVNLKKGFYNGDTIFLAHLKYDAYTQKIVKLIYSEIEVQYQDGRQIPAFPKIGPWFLGAAKLLVRGIPFNGGKSFLGLQIIGLSEPGGTEIERLRENRSNAANPAGPEAEGSAWTGIPVRRPNQRPEIIDLTAHESPDHGSATLELEDSEIIILGTRRQVKSLRDDQAKDKAGASGESGDGDTFSSGDPCGSGKGIDQASIHTPEITQPEMESEGALRDIWNAALHLKKTYKDVTRVEWYTSSKGFHENDEPQLMALSHYADDDTFQGAPIPTSTRRWPFLDPDKLSKMRGLLVIRIRINSKNIYIIEIQRRVKKVLEANGRAKEKEEALRGLVFTLDSQDGFIKWIQTVRSHVRRVEGRVHKLTTFCPGEADVFKHTAASSDGIPCWAALHNALRKVGVVPN